MAFWNRKREESRATSNLASPSDWLFESLIGTAGAAGQRVTVDRALGLAPVYAAVSLISEQVGQLPFKVYRRVEDGERLEARRHPAWRLLNERPNSGTPAGRFWSTVTSHLLLHGNAFIEKKRATVSGSVEELAILPPSQVSVKWWPKLMDKTFVHESPDGSQKRELDSDQVLHVMNLSLDGVVGMSVIHACRDSLGTALARSEFEGKFYNQGTVLSGVVEMEGDLKSDVAIKRFADSIKVLFAGSPKSHGVPVLEEGAKWKQVSSPLRDLQFVESQNMTRTDIAVMFKLPPNYLGGSSGDGLTYSTLEMNQTQFALHAIAPITNTIAEAISQDPSILPQGVHSAEFVLEGMLRANSEARAAFYEKLVGMKAMHPDEVRAKENMPPLTQDQRREMNPAPVVSPEPQQLDLEVDMAATNGNGAGG